VGHATFRSHLSRCFMVFDVDWSDGMEHKYKGSTHSRSKNVRSMPSLDQVSRDTPLRLNIAAALAYPDGSMTPSGLRREAARGRLVIERTAGKDYTTLGAIEHMRDLCRLEARERGCGSEERAVTEKPGNHTMQCGSSETENIQRAQAAARMIVQELKGHSPNTSTGSTSSKRPKGRVIRLKSR
jgi:hypothetical protein